MNAKLKISINVLRVLLIWRLMGYRLPAVFLLTRDFSFIEEYALSGKTIILFVAHGTDCNGQDPTFGSDLQGGWSFDRKLWEANVQMQKLSVWIYREYDGKG